MKSTWKMSLRWYNNVKIEFNEEGIWIWLGIMSVSGFCYL